MTIWSEEKQTLEDFIEEDLPFLIQSHYEATIVVLKTKLQSQNRSLDAVTSDYPNFLTKVRYHLFFFFAHQISELSSHSNSDFNTLYQFVTETYQEQYIDSFVDRQIQEYLKSANS